MVVELHSVISENFTRIVENFGCRSRLSRVERRCMRNPGGPGISEPQFLYAFTHGFRVILQLVETEMPRNHHQTPVAQELLHLFVALPVSPRQFNIFETESLHLIQGPFHVFTETVSQAVKLQPDMPLERAALTSQWGVARFSIGGIRTQRQCPNQTQ